MCIFLCANSRTCELVQAIHALEERGYIELASLCQTGHDSESALETADVLDEESVRKISRGYMLREPMPRVFGRHAVRSACEWKHPFNALAEAWGRLLTLVGLRT